MATNVSGVLAQSRADSRPEVFTYLADTFRDPAFCAALLQGLNKPESTYAASSLQQQVAELADLQQELMQMLATSSKGLSF